MKNRLEQLFKEVYNKYWGDQSDVNTDNVEKAELQKSRPRITLPKFKRISNRPDQEVRLLETGRQKDIYGRVAANAELKDLNIKFPTRVQGSRKIINSKPELHENIADRISGRFDRSTLGLNADTAYGPKSAAVAGKLRTKFEAPDEEHQGKLDAHKEKTAQAKEKYNQDYQKWRQEVESLPSGSTEYYNKIAEKPKFKAPRRPSKKQKETTDLPPEQRTERGRAIDSTIEHEGLHHTMDQIKHKYGPQVGNQVEEKLLSAHHPDTLKAVGNFIADTRGYKRGSSFNEEILAHTRDILVNPKTREQFKNYLKGSMNSYNLHGRAVTDEDVNQHIKNLKVGHQKAYKIAQDLEPAEAGSNEANLPKKLAASEGHRSFTIPKFKKLR